MSISKSSRSHGVGYRLKAAKNKKYQKKSGIDKLKLGKDAMKLVPFIKNLQTLSSKAYKNSCQDEHWIDVYKENALVPVDNNLPFLHYEIALTTEGIASYQRLGEYMQIKKIWLGIRIESTSTTSVSAVRVMVLRVNAPTGAPVIGDFLETANVTTDDYTICGYQNENRKNFKVYYDKTHLLQGTTSAFDTKKTIIFSQDVDFRMQYSGAAANVGSCIRNMPMLLICTDEATDGVNVKIQSRVIFLP